MADNFKMKWDQTGEKFYETGTDRGALYPMNNSGAYPKELFGTALLVLQSHLQVQIRQTFTQITSSTSL